MSVTETIDFFKQKRTASEIKSELLKSYFPAWCELEFNQKDQSAATLLLVDLLAGPVFDRNNSPVGPAVILDYIYQSAGTENDLNAVVKTFFLDPAKLVTEALQTELMQLPYLEQLTHAPVILNEPAQQEYMTGLLNSNLPALLITDPFGYAYAQEMWVQALQKWHIDVLLVFNPGKMKAAITQNDADNQLQQLLGNRFTILKKYYRTENSARKKEQAALEMLVNTLKDHNYYPFTFKINLPDTDQTNHYVLFGARAKQSYLRMKEIVAPYSDYQEDGVPLFSVNQKPQPPLLPGFFRFLSTYCMENLIEDLGKNRSRFHYRTIQEIYEEHAIGTNFIRTNYLQACEELRRQGRINLVDERNKQVKKVTEAAIVFYKLHGRG